MRTIHVIVDGEGDELDVCDSAETAAAECQNWNVCRELGPYRLVQYITKPGPDYDWPTFWQSLTPTEVAAALRAATKVAGPWSTPHARTGYWVRRAAITSEVVAKVESEAGKERYYASILDADAFGQKDSLWAAQAAADAALVAKGWVLL